MNDTTPYESARSYDSEESTVETVLSTVEDKKEEEEEEDKFIACSHCGSKYKFLPTLKVPEDIFPPQIGSVSHSDISATNKDDVHFFLSSLFRWCNLKKYTHLYVSFGWLVIIIIIVIIIIVLSTIIIVPSILMKSLPIELFITHHFSLNYLLALVSSTISGK
jgi:hypothetical protein